MRAPRPRSQGSRFRLIPTSLKYSRSSARGRPTAPIRISCLPVIGEVHAVRVYCSQITSSLRQPRAGIGKIGWHTLRHTFATLLHDSKAPLAVQKELLRHADIQTTMNIYTQAVGERKRQAASRVVKMLLKR